MSLKKNFYIAVHPGEVLKDMLSELGMSQTALSKHLNVAQPKINEICTGRRGLSPVMAHKLGRALGQSPEFWLGLQKEWELSQVDSVDYKSVKRIKLQGSKVA